MLPSVQVDLAPDDSDDDDDDLQKAMSYALSHKSVSANSLMKELRIGYSKASNLLDHLEDRGIVGPGDPGKSREVITPG